MLCGVVGVDRGGQFLSRIHNYVCTYIHTYVHKQQDNVLDESDSEMSLLR